MQKRGKTVPLKAVLQQGRVSEAQAIQDSKEISTCGFTEKDQQTLTSKLELLESGSAAQIESRAQSKANRVAEVKALADAKAFKHRLGAAITDLFARAQYEDGFTMPVSEDVFRVGPVGRLHNSTPKVLEYLGRVRRHVEKVKTLLAPYFGGGDALALLDEAVSKLKAADTAQELSLKGLPEETLDVYQLKGEVLFLIERLNRAGRAAFDGHAVKASQYNKDLLLRARRSGVEAIDGGEKAEVAS